MSAQDNANIEAQAQAQAQAQQAADAQANAQAQQVPTPQVIGAKPGVIRGPALFGPGGVYQGPISRRVGPGGIIRGPTFFGPGGVYQGPVSRRIGGTTRVVRPDGTTVLQTAPAQTRVINQVRYGGYHPLGGFIPGPQVVAPPQNAAQAQEDATQAEAQVQEDVAAQQEAQALAQAQAQVQGNPFIQSAIFGPPVNVQAAPVEVLGGLQYGGYTPLRPLTIEELGLINIFKPAIEEALGQTFAVWAPQGVQAQAIAGVNLRFFIGTEAGIVQATITRDLNGIAQLTLVYPPLGDFAETQDGGYTPLRPLTIEDLALIDSFKPAIEEALGQTLEAFEPQAVQVQVVAGTNLRFFIGTNAGLVQATIFTDLQGNAELSAQQPPIVAAPVLDASVPLPAGGYTLPRTLTIEDLDRLNFFRPAVEDAVGQILAVFEPLTVQSQVVAGVNYRYLINTEA